MKINIAISLSLLIATLLLSSGCEINRLKNAEELFNSGRYAGSIEEFDHFIRLTNNGALKTRAELMRSQSYYELGLMAMNRKSWDLSIKFFKLSNSETSDVKLGEVYRILADDAMAARDLPLALQYISSIIKEIPRSALVPEMLYRRIVLMVDVFSDREAAWKDYMTLFDNYSNNSYELQARVQVQKFIETKVEYATTLAEQEYFNDALVVLFELARYPVLNAERLNRLISDNYQSQAEQFIIDQDYIEADRLFRIAVQYFPAKRQEIDARLRGIASLFVLKGNSLLAERDFDNALLNYRKTFDIISDYEPAMEAINRLLTIKSNIEKAAFLKIDAEKLEAAGKYAEALKLYQAANQLDDKAEYQLKIGQMQNLIEAKRDPAGFAQRIINEYRGGLLNRRVSEVRTDLLSRYKKTEIRDSGWKMLLSTGQYKYEARYDLMSPQETYFYIWQINLRDRSIVPLNKLSEKLMQ
ncbi:MAG: hypothetical protein CVU48_07680 [Candidatus Cloacimonetes bacterium HGW-Cloacimonetes-1]|jgi:tetratricopeptide (TPR) repeat protein|nr:MAG: hypothetical protein CVU48_07680 [Candidatus Cloacimonetes bacterium HGW-Cloacimonetes-1]